MFFSELNLQSPSKVLSITSSPAPSSSSSLNSVILTPTNSISPSYQHMSPPTSTPSVSVSMIEMKSGSANGGPPDAEYPDPKRIRLEPSFGLTQ